MKHFNLKFVLLLVELVTVVNLFSQDKHDYVTPLGKSLFYKEVKDANRISLKMNEISAPSTGMDGLVVSFNMKQDLSLVSRPLKLISFTNDNEANSYLDVFYDKGTITLRRKMHPGASSYYDYNLYDPMFTVDKGITQWEVHIYFTGYFLWIQTRDIRKPLNNKWHAPIFFGINLLGNDYMKNYLERSNSSILVFGDPNPSTTFTMPEEISIYEFKYAELKDELQTHFCAND